MQLQLTPCAQQKLVLHSFCRRCAYINGAAGIGSSNIGVRQMRYDMAQISEDGNLKRHRTQMQDSDGIKKGGTYVAWARTRQRDCDTMRHTCTQQQ